MPHVDLNADLGESYSVWTLGADRELMPVLTSANVACGWHGGDPRVMDDTVRLAKEAGVAIGAHPSFPDRDGFGRRVLDVSAREAETDTLYQVAALQGFCHRHGVALQHVKAHGAFYNHANRNPEVAKGIAAGVAAVDKRLLLVALPDSGLERAGREAGLAVAREGFCDRAYNPDGSLVDRRQPGALHSDAAIAAEQALRMATEGKVRCLDGTVIDVQVDTLCCHGDNPHAVAFAREVRRRLQEAGVEMRAMGTSLGAAKSLS
ncbi:MAG: 5-oxoprolinase subunit PxpA [Candidatus Dormiibacterota bacterium]